MKVRVKTTGDIIEINEDCSFLYAENYDKFYNLNELEFHDVKEKSLPKDEPDYLEKLKHQYAGMVMQGMFANPAFKDVDIEFVVLGAVGAATELIKKLKEEEK